LDYWQKRQTEAKYRLLFQLSSDPVLLVDAETLHITDANRAAGRAFGLAHEKLIGLAVTTRVDPLSHAALKASLNTAKTSDSSVSVNVRLAGLRGQARIEIAAFASGSTSVLLVRVCESEISDAKDQLLDLIEQTADCVVLADVEGRIIAANQAFVALTQIPDENHVKGDLLSDWISCSHRELMNILAKIRDTDAVPRVSTTLRSIRGVVAAAIDLSAIRIRTAAGEDFLGFILRISDPARNTETSGNSEWIVH